MEWKERISIDPSILVGKPVVKGTRLAVEFILDLLAQGWAEEDIRACIGYASAVLHAK